MSTLRPVFEIGNVLVTMEWIPEEGVSYCTSIDQVVDFRYIQRTLVSLILPYNTPISVLLWMKQ